MNIISWNLNHRTNEKPIPDEAVEFFRLKNADVIILNEFVDAPSRDSFKEALRALGYTHQSISPKFKKHNQIFIASKHEIVLGDLEAPPMDNASKGNFLHVILPQHNMELVGFRAPSYKTAALRREYWNQVYTIMDIAKARPICFIGDVNTNPFKKAGDDITEITLPDVCGYRAPNPKGDWSYKSINGKYATRIDHAYLSDSLDYSNPEYIVSYEGITLAGSKYDHPVTDHAVYSIDLSPSS